MDSRIVLTLLLVHWEYATSMDIPLLTKLSAPLKAELDISDFTRQMKELFRSEQEHLNQEVQNKITEGLKQVEDTLVVHSNASIMETVNKNLGRQGCQSGSNGIGKSNPPNPGRQRSNWIRFNPGFVEPPALIYGLTKLDTNKTTNTRINVEVANLTKYGFTMTIKSWHTSLTYDAIVRWMACPK